MKLTWQPLTLDLRTTFRIAHGASDQRFNVITTLSDGDFVGIGEAAAVPYHGESQAGIIAYLAGLFGTTADPGLFSDPFLVDDFLGSLPPGSNAARAAIDIALHDLIGKRLNQPLYRIFGLDPTRIPETSFTIAMDAADVMAERSRQSAWPVIKIKLGGDDDEKTIAAIRRASSARLRVDANAGWSRNQAAALIPRLASYGLELVEQPLPVGDIDGLRWLRAQNFGLPIFADESVKSAKDVAAHAGAVDGVVIKLMKTGGIRQALCAIHTARSLDLQVMLSCMVESSIGVTAAAHLAPLCDFIDLDGPLLIKNDPYRGIQYLGAKISLPNLPGLGLTAI